MPRRIIVLRFISCLSILLPILGEAQEKAVVIDEIIAKVGDEIILKSELEYEINRAIAEKKVVLEGDVKSQVIENIIVSKLLKNAASIDSISATEDEVERYLDQRMAGYLRYAGSAEKLEQYFKKSIQEIRGELREPTRDMIVIKKMQDTIVQYVKVTPSEVRAKYDKIVPDSLPQMPEQLIIEQITFKPQVSDKEKDRIQEKLRNIRDQINKGKTSFTTMAVLYSEDTGSATKGGELGYMSRNQLVRNFANVAFSLPAGKISKIVQTEFGFHIIQLIDKKGDKVNCRHILMKPKVDQTYKKIAKAKLDSVRNSIINDSISFNKAAMLYSDDKDTKNNGGLLMNPKTAGPYFNISDLPPAISRNLKGVKKGKLSPIFYDASARVPSFKFFRVKDRIPTHKANPNYDWDIFEKIVLNEKKQEVLDEWISEKIKDTYIELSESIKGGKFKYKWNND